MEAHKRSRNPKYNPRPLSRFDQGISPDALRNWRSSSKNKRGGQQKYSDSAIEIILSLRLLFHLPLRQAEGFVTSIFQLMKLALPIPDHTALLI